MDITALLLKNYAPKPGEIGKYNASAIWGIINGYTSAEEFLKGKGFSFQEAIRCWQGTSKHEQIQNLFKDLDGYEIEKRAEYKYKDFIIVGKADLLTKDKVIEIKTSTEIIPKAKSWHIFQTKLYCVLFDRPQGLIVQPIINPHTIELKEIGIVKQDLDWFKKQMELLDNFHNQLKQYGK